MIDQSHLASSLPHFCLADEDAVLELATKLVVADSYKIRKALEEAGQQFDFNMPTEGKAFAAWRSRVS